MNKTLFFIFFLGLFVLSSKSAHAYLDLGTGSYVFQLALGGILGAIFTIKLYYHKIIKIFKKSSPKGDGSNEEKQPEQKE